MFGISGAGLNKIKNMQSGGVRHRWSVDQWDKVGRRHLLWEPLRPVLTSSQQSTIAFAPPIQNEDAEH
jgi:hypothetical protein